MTTVACRALAILASLAISLAGLPASSMLPGGAASALGVVTVGAVSAALSAALDQFKQAVSQSGDELRGVGNSLQGNAQNVLQDLNSDLRGRMDQGADTLDREEARLVADAESLTAQLRRSTSLLLAKAGDEARKTIVEADVAAYDTLYSLPCRDQRPRITAALPGAIVPSRDEPILVLEGNYLTQGEALTATVEGRSAKIVERLEHSIRVVLPEDLLDGAINGPRTLSVRISGLESVERALWFGLFCRERRVAQTAQAAAVTLEPPIRLSLSGQVDSTKLVEVTSVEPPIPFSRTGSDHCDDAFDVSMQYCTANPDAIRTTGALAVTSANCGSGASGPQPSGPRCVLVPARVQGCGANRGPFHTWLGCNGRGWLNYSVTLTVTTKTRVDAGHSRIEVPPSVADRSWSFPLPAGGDDQRHSYSVTVRQTRGTMVLNQWTISAASPNSGPISSRIAEGVLAIRFVE